MPANIELSPEDISLGDLTLRPDSPHIEGEALRVTGVNAGTTNLWDISVNLSGKGAPVVQMAQDDEGLPHVWAAPGESIIVTSDVVMPEDKFYFWAKTVFNEDDFEGKFPFNFVIKATSIG